MEAYVKEGAYVLQSTTQLTDNVIDYDSREAGKVLNVDNKLAMIVDDMEAVIDLSANADSTSTDSQASNGSSPIQLMSSYPELTPEAAKPESQ